MSYEPIWGSIIAWYLFLAGLGGGAFVTSALVSWLYPQAQTMRKLGRYIALVAVAIGLVLLMVDARAGFANPWRFALLLSHLGSSVMSWGVVFLAVFMLIDMVAVVLEICDSRFRAADPAGVWAHKHPRLTSQGVSMPVWLTVAGVVFALLVAGYTGALLGVVKTFPLWNHPLLPALFVVSAMSTGVASVVLGGLVMAHHEAEAVVRIKHIHLGLVATEIVLVFLMLFVLSGSSPDAHASVMRLVSGDFALQFWLCFAMLGLLLPLAIDLWETACPMKKSTAQKRFAGLLGEAGVLVGGFFLRYLVLVAALPAGFVAGMVF